jgi:hypothetical protein
MNAVNTEVVEHENGLVTQGLSSELDPLCLDAHQSFLRTNMLTYWQLVILQVYGTPYVVIFSGASGGDETPNYKLGDVQNLIAEVEEILKAHYEQWRSRMAPKAST